MRSCDDEEPRYRPRGKEAKKTTKVWLSPLYGDESALAGVRDELAATARLPLSSCITTPHRDGDAPMDGTVVSIDARQGQTLNTNQQAPVLMRIADLSTATSIAAPSG